MSKLILIDGHAILHRAFHALPPNFSAPDGTPTNAVYGFTTMLLRLLSDLKPTHLAVAFDLPAPTFRSQAYTAYQAKRPEMVSNLADQIPLVHEMLKALGIPYFEVAGYEADDCIGTLAKQAIEGLPTTDYRLQQNKKAVDSRQWTVDEVIVVTGDRDMLQLVNDQVKVCVPVKGLGETKSYDRETILSEFGVKPEQWVDVKALKGDASDNYPGVPGIGPKTAQDLINRFGSLESLYAKLGELGSLGGKEKKVAEKLAAGAEGAGMAKKLAQIVTDVPGVHLDWKKVEVEGIDWKRGIRYMSQRLGFRTIVRRIENEFIGKNETMVVGSETQDKKMEKRDKSESGPDSAKASASTKVPADKSSGKQMELI